MRVLVACELSGVVREAFRQRGHIAYSCDLEPSVDDSRFHFICDVREILNENWDLMVAHPPCQYLSASGLHWNTRTPGRSEKTEEALEFVKELMAAPISRICIENPVGCISTRIRPSDQSIQPWQFGHNASKTTKLWLKNLPNLQRTIIVPPNGYFYPAWRHSENVYYKAKDGVVFGTYHKKLPMRWGNQTPSGQNKLGPSKDRAKIRAKTYYGVGAAMAKQWG